MRGIISHTLFSAKRDKLFVGMMFAIIFSVLLSGFLGKTCLAEGDEMRMVYSSVAARTIIILGLMVFISFHIRRLFDNKEIEMFLSKSISRKSILYSFFCAFIVMSVILIVPVLFIMSIFLKVKLVGLIYWGSVYY